LALAIGTFAPFALAFGGCGESERREEMANLRSLSVFYSQYRAQSRGRAPADEATFRKFIESYGPAALSQAGVSTIDELFVSKRDGKPFVVKYRGNRSWPLREAVAYESEGVDGIRYFATLVGGVDEIPEEEFRSAQLAPRTARQ
jgi:hypothetical protein